MSSSPTTFVGEDRRRHLETLVSAFADARDTGQSRLIVLTAPTGWGKTRVVQELYGRLVALADDRYWPDRLDEGDGSWLQARKRVFPAPFEVDQDVEIPFLWLGASCQRDQMGRELAALQYAEKQFQAHVGPMVSAIERRGDRWKARLSAVGAVAGLFGLPDPVNMAMTWHGIASSTWELVSGEWKGLRDRRAGKTARWIDTLGETETEPAVEFARQVARLSGEDLPVVLVVDDAHWADPGTVAFVGTLLRERGHVLIVATAWPDRLALQEGEPDTFGHALRPWIRASRAESLVLDRMPDSALARLVEAAGEGVEPRLVRGLCERADGNPNRLQGLMALRVVRRALAAGGPALSEEQIEALPTGDAEIIHMIWRDLPDNVQEVLALGTVQGTEFNPDWVPAAAELLDLTDAATGLEQAESPWGWVRAVDAALAAFVEAGLYERAREESRTLFLPDELARARAAMLGWAVEQKSRPDWDDLSTAARRAVLEAHVAGADEGMIIIDDDVIDSAWQLVLQLWKGHELERLCDVARLGIDWSSARPSAAETNWKLRYRLADATGERGDAAGAARQLRSMIEDHTRERGHEDFDTYYLRFTLAYWLSALGQDEEALAELDEILPVWTDTLGPKAGSTVSARYRRASILQGLGRLDEARAEYDELLAIKEDLGPAHQEVLWLRLTRARNLGQSGRVAAAVEELERIVETSAQSLGPTHLDTLDAAGSLGFWLVQAGRPAEGLERMEWVRHEFARILGEDHPSTMNTRGDMLLALRALGRDEDVARAARDLLLDQERIMGPDDPRTIQTRGRLALALSLTREHEPAIAEASRAFDDCTRLFGSDHPDTMEARSNLAICYWGADRLDETLTQLELLLDDQRRILGPEHPFTIETLSNVAVAHMGLGRPEKAAPIFEESLDFQREVLGKRNPTTLATRRKLLFARLDVAASAKRRDDMGEILAELDEYCVEVREALGPDHRLTKLAARRTQEVKEELRSLDLI